MLITQIIGIEKKTKIPLIFALPLTVTYQLIGPSYRIIKLRTGSSGNEIITLQSIYYLKYFNFPFVRERALSRFIFSLTVQ